MKHCNGEERAYTEQRTRWARRQIRSQARSGTQARMLILAWDGVRLDPG